MSEQVQEYRGEKIVVRFDGGKCIHSRNCVLGKPEVFQANVPGAWIKPDNASTEEVVMTALACPSGAITYERVDGGAQEAPPLVNVARVRENGPLAIHADLRIGNAIAHLRATLCRCGSSKNKPYCDGSHTAAGFRSTGEPPTQPSEQLAARNGVVIVKPIKNGPLEVSGNLELVSGTGRTLNRTLQTWLCRCGESQNKPYCDGTHKKIGFKSD
ncbi:MAG: CDGSH iron-sulfur domain-containing protein [Betaproteobacteria bacterium]|nr:CDGSH iron-sulfur domain-containing protein [Betaproteobacteria bacterium]